MFRNALEMCYEFVTMNFTEFVFLCRATKTIFLIVNSDLGQISLHFIGFNFSKSLTQNRPTSFQNVDKFHRFPPTIKPITTIRHGGVDEKSIFQCFFSRFCFMYGRLTRLIFLLRFLASFCFSLLCSTHANFPFYPILTMVCC